MSGDERVHMPQFKVSESIDGVSIDAWVTIDQNSAEWPAGALAEILDTTTPNTIAGANVRRVARAGLSDALLLVRSAIRHCANNTERDIEDRQRQAIAEAKAEGIEQADAAYKAATATKDQTILDLNAKVTAAEGTDRALKAALAYITELETAAKQEAAAQQQAKDAENARRRNKRAANKARAARHTSKRK